MVFYSVGVKFPSQQWALGPVRSPAMTKGEKGAPKDFRPNPVELNLFKRRPRRNVSSDVPNTGPMCALSIVKNHSKQMWVVGWASQNRKKEESVRRLGGNHNCRIKCKEATFPAALMWRRQANSVTLVNATYRKIR